MDGDVPTINLFVYPRFGIMVLRSAGIIIHSRSSDP